MFENIMVIPDGSEYSDKTVDAAIEIAKKFHSKVTAIYLIDENTSLIFDNLEDEGNEILKNITEKGKKEGVMVIEHLIAGNPLRDMKMISKKTQVDSVVLNPNSKKQEGMLASVTDSIIKNFDIPIVLIR